MFVVVDENDEVDVGNFGIFVESVGLCEDLVIFLLSVGYELRVAWLGWVLFFRYVFVLFIEFLCRECLVNYMCEIKVILLFMCDIMCLMFFFESVDVESEDDLSSSWRGVDWDNFASVM